MNPEGTQEEAMAATADNSSSSSSANNDVHSHRAIVKGKRTKRQRILQVVAPRPVPTSPASSSSGDFSSSTTTEEEEDMANCLMLLARGHTGKADTKKRATRLEGEGGGGEGGEKISSRRSADAAATTNGKADSYVYECKTCNKCFPSFQALGGHRASHKKPKTPSAAAAAADDKKAVNENSLQISIISDPKLNVLPNSDGGRTSANSFNSHNDGDTAAANNSKTTRVHECSICGSEFSSGQALGGHMRRHRAVATVPEPPQEARKKERSLLSLDLNLPAPSDDDRGEFPRSPSFAFAGKPPLIFSASALVDCHY